MTSSVTNISIPDFNYSRPLDVHRWSDYSEVNDFVNEIYLILKSTKGHENTGKKLVKVLLLDLYVAWSADPDLMIMLVEIIILIRPSLVTMSFMLARRLLILLMLSFLKK